MNKWRVQEATTNNNMISNSNNTLQIVDNVEKSNAIIVKRIGTGHNPIREKEDAFEYDGHYFYHCKRITKRGVCYYWYFRVIGERRLRYYGKYLAEHLQNRIYV